MLPYIAEFIGTFMLILLGDGVCCNVSLNKSGMQGAGSIQITFAWGLAVLIPACIFGAASGASFNPALTIALAAIGRFSWAMVPGYIVAQVAGAFCGGIFLYILFLDQFKATKDDPGAMRGVFCTGPSVRNLPLNILSEAVGTFVLVFAILGFGNVDSAGGIGNLYVFGLIVSIGMSLGGLTGYAINPARDFGPRLAHAVLPIEGKGDSDFGYAIVPIVGPIIGGLVAAFLFQAIPW
ncbi:MAG: aquaporin family protein [Lachnospiraceae bacterium]|nr:aquaporin family protein [Lachnospiraceae bacterium]